jgi:DNA polymerase-3 subunit delta'
LRTPSVDAVTKLLIERDGIEPKMAEFASSAAQGHIGRAKYLATSEEARKIREKILNIPSTVKDLASALEAANTLLDLAKKQTLSELEIQNEAEIVKLKEAYGSTGSRLVTGGNKAIKELERNLKSHSNRTINDYIYWALSEMTYKHDKRIAEHDELIKDLILSTSAFICVKFEFNTKLQLESYFIRKFYGITK